MRRSVLIVLLWSFVALVSALPASTQTGPEKRAEVTLISESSLAKPGDTIWFGLQFELDEGWHIYWRNPGDAGIPPEILWSEATDIEALGVSSFSWPAPELLPVVPNEIMDYGYSDQVVLPFRVTVPEATEGPVLFEGVADYLICENVCIPESAEIRLLQYVGAATLPDQAASNLIQAALDEVPAAFTGETALSLNGEVWTLSLSGEQVTTGQNTGRFFPYEHEIKHAAAQPLRYGPEGLQLDLMPDGDPAALPQQLEGVVQTEQGYFAFRALPAEPLAGTATTTPLSGAPIRGGASLPFLLLFALIGGFILNFMPCVLPVLSIKALGIVSSVAEGDQASVRTHGLWYTAGVLVSFAVLGIAIVALRALTGIAIWGFWLQNPLIVTALILIIFLIGLWLLGLFELGTSVQAVGSDLAAKQGNVGAFFTGVLAAIVGAPCTGPFLGAALGAVMLQPAPIVLLVLVFIGLGMALPFLLISFVPNLQRLIPKPGAWMESLKQVFAFPMFLTAAWLISVLGSLSGYRVAAAVVAGAALISFAIWALKSANQGGKAILMAVLGLGSIIPIFGLMGALSAPAIGLFDVGQNLVILAGFVAAFWIVAKLTDSQITFLTRTLAIGAGVIGFALPLNLAMQPSAAKAGTSEAYATATYETEAWSAERVAELREQGRHIFVDFTAEWCVTCQANKLQTLQTAPVAAAFEANNVAFLVADFTNFDAEIARELQAHGRAGVPLYLWYAAGAEQAEVLPELLSIDLITELVGASD